MPLSVVHGGVVREERKFVLALAAYQVSVNVQRIAALPLYDRQDRSSHTLQQVNCCREGDLAHRGLIAPVVLKMKEAGSAKPGLENCPATGQVKRGTCWI